MSLWGATSGAESKPKNLTDAEKDLVFANESGWSRPAAGNDNPNAQPEVLACVSNLGIKLGAANITNIKMANILASPISGSETVQIDVVFNEKVFATWTSTAPNITLDTPDDTTTTIVASVVGADKDTAKNVLRFETGNPTVNHLANAGNLTINNATSIALGDGSINDANPDGTASATASGVDMTTAGPDGATNLKAAFDASVATVVVDGDL